MSKKKIGQNSVNGEDGEAAPERRPDHLEAEEGKEKEIHKRDSSAEVERKTKREPKSLITEVVLVKQKTRAPAKEGGWKTAEGRGRNACDRRGQVWSSSCVLLTSLWTRH